jgi:4a-hydroxytetrahydrobiopterin dehydratase
MSSLSQKKCVACEGDVRPFNRIEADVLLKQVPGWSLKDDTHLERAFTFKDFAEALAFVNKVGAIAESEGHHPDITLGWGKVGIELTTHAIKGLSENDFILAAKINDIT